MIGVISYRNNFAFLMINWFLMTTEYFEKISIIGGKQIFINQLSLAFAGHIRGYNNPVTAVTVTAVTRLSLC